MKRSCTIIISHYKSVNFLHTCIKQVRKFAHPEIEQKIVVVDQSDELTFNNLANTYAKDPDMWLVHTRPLYSGYGLDFLFHNNFFHKSDYVCQLHADAFPISHSWLSLPIKLIEENNLAFVGQLHFIADGTHDIYPPQKFFSMSPTFNVAKTEIYKEMSLNAGFTRFHSHPESGLKFLNRDWDEWAQEDYDKRGSDDDVVAFYWEDKYLQHDKLGLAVTGFVQPKFGRIIDDLVFHFGSCREALGVMDTMPELYQHYTKKINEGYYNDELISEMVALAKANTPPQIEILRRNHWDGKLKISSPPSDAINKRIEELKNN